MKTSKPKWQVKTGDSVLRSNFSTALAAIKYAQKLVKISPTVKFYVEEINTIWRNFSKLNLLSVQNVVYFN